MQNGHARILALEKLARLVTCHESGKKNCTQPACRLSQCQPTWRGMASTQKVSLGVRLREEAILEADRAQSSADRFADERRFAEAKRNIDAGEVGLDLMPIEAERVRRFCTEKQICIHDVRLLLNSGMASATRDASLPIRLDHSHSLGRKAFCLTTLAILFSFATLTVAVCPVSCPERAVFIFAYVLSAVMAVLLLFRGPILLGCIAQRVRKQLPEVA